MEAASEQNLPDTGEILDVCQILQQEDLSESCRSIELNFRINLENASLQLLRNLENEWNNAVAVNPNLISEKIHQKNRLYTKLIRLFEIFMNECKVKKTNVISYLPQINEIRQRYISKLTNFNEVLHEFTINDTDEIRRILTQLEIEKDSLRNDHNKLLIEYNSLVLDLQLQLDRFKQGIVTVTDPTSGQENIEFFSEIIDEWRSICVIPGETVEERIARDTEFNTWKEILRLPSNWFVEVQSPQLETPVHIDVPSDPENVNIQPYSFDPTAPLPRVGHEIVIPPLNEGEFNVPSPDFSQINIPSLSRLDEISVPSTSAYQPLNVPPLAPIQSSERLSPAYQPLDVPPSVVIQPSEGPPLTYQPQVPSPPSPTYTERSSGSSPRGSDEFRPSGNIRDTQLHRKHIENEKLLRRVKKSYGKLRNEVNFYTRSHRLSHTYQEIQQLNTTIKDLSREWRTLRETRQEEPRRRDEDGRDRERGERTGHPSVQRISMKSVEQIYTEWNAVRNNLRGYATRINDDWNKIIELQTSLETLYAEIEINDNDEQILRAEELINRELILLRTKKEQLKEEVRKLKSLESNLSEQLRQLQQNLLRRKAKLERQIDHSRNSRG